MMTRRRSLIAFGTSALGAGALAPLAPFAQTTAALPVIGWLHFSAPELDSPAFTALKEGLSALGWKEGVHYLMEARWAGGRIERLPALAVELAAKRPAVIVVSPTQPLVAMVKAAPQTAVIQVNASDPVTTGFAASLARPGGMVTGLSNMAGDLTEKYLELLLAAAPRIKRVGFLLDSTNLARATLADAARRSVVRLKVEARFAEAGTPDEIAPALARLAKEEVQGLILVPSPLFGAERQRLVKLGNGYRWPMMSNRAEFVTEGALLSYGIDSAEQFRRAAHYVDRILKGARPGDLPIEQPTRFVLAVNLKTASALGLKLPQSILIQATQVIE